MGKYVCRPVNYTGVGYKDDVKQCEYVCYPVRAGKVMKSEAKKIIAPARDLSAGDVCYGVDYHEQWINSSGTFSNMPDRLGSFTIEIGSWSAWWNYSSGLRDEVKRAFGE